MDKTEFYFKNEMYQEMYNAIRYFLTSVEIREGKFEGNEILIHKLNRKTAIIYKEYELEDGSYEYSHEAYIFEIDNLICNIDKLAANRALTYNSKF